MGRSWGNVTIGGCVMIDGSVLLNNHLTQGECKIVEIMFSAYNPPHSMNIKLGYNYVSFTCYF